MGRTGSRPGRRLCRGGTPGRNLSPLRPTGRECVRRPQVRVRARRDRELRPAVRNHPVEHTGDLTRQRTVARLRSAMPPSLLALTGLGLLLGFRHAFEPDHLAAVSTLATRQERLLDACRLGLAWAVGHTASVGVVVAAIILFGLRLPDRLWPAADFLVAVLLIGLGASVIRRYARGRWHLHLAS